MRQGGRAIPRPLTPRQRSYLKELPKAGRVGAALEAIGVRQKNLPEWRKNETFRAAEQAVREKMAAEGPEQLAKLKRTYDMAAINRAEGVKRWAGLTRQQKLYLSAYRRLEDRVDACECAGLTWAAVKEQVASDPAFKAAVDEVEDELTVRVYDAQRRRAIKTGDPAALNALRRSEADRKPEKTSPLDRKARVEQLRQEKAGTVN